MTSTFRLGRLAGVDVGIHWSVLIIFALLAWSLSASRFPAAYPGNPPWAYVVAEVAAAVALLLGLVAHEVSHRLDAPGNRLAGERTTIWFVSRCGPLPGHTHTSP